MAADSPRYFLSTNQQLRDRLEALNRRARAQGMLSEWVVSIREVLERLETEPEAAGDPLRRLGQLNLTRYRLLMNRICVNYATHDLERVVFIQSIDPALGHPLQDKE